MLTLISATIAYLVARNRTTADRTALKTAEEQRNQARERADALHAERDRAHRQLADLGQTYTAALTEHRVLDELLGRPSAELDAGSERSRSSRTACSNSRALSRLRGRS